MEMRGFTAIPYDDVLQTSNSGIYAAVECQSSIRQDGDGPVHCRVCWTNYRS